MLRSNIVTLLAGHRPRHRGPVPRRRPHRLRGHPVVLDRRPPAAAPTSTCSATCATARSPTPRARRAPHTPSPSARSSRATRSSPGCGRRSTRPARGTAGIRPGHRRPDRARPAPTSTSTGPTSRSTRGDTEGAFAANPHPINSTYDFSLLDAGAGVGTGLDHRRRGQPVRHRRHPPDQHRRPERDPRHRQHHDAHQRVHHRTPRRPADLRVSVIKSFDDDVTLTGPATSSTRRRQRHPAVPGQRRPGRHRRQHHPRRGHRGSGQHRRGQQLPRGRRRLRPVRRAERQGARQGLHPRDHRPTRSPRSRLVALPLAAAPVVALAGPVSNFYVGLVDTCSSATPAPTSR